MAVSLSIIKYISEGGKYIEEKRERFCDMDILFKGDIFDRFDQGLCFVNHASEVTLFAVFRKDGLPVMKRDIPVTLSLRRSQSRHVELSREQYPFTLDPANVVIKKGKVTITVKFKDCAKLAHEKDQFVFQANFPNGTTFSKPFRIVRYRIDVKKIRASSDEYCVQRKKKWCWYKEEGGLHNTLVVEMQLVNASGPVALSGDREIPIRIILEYSNEGTLPNQEILKVRLKKNGERKHIRLEKDGKAIFNFRINDVSSKHQNRAFRLRVAPNLERDAMLWDVAGGITNGVTVMSKRTRTEKKTSVQLSKDGEGKDAAASGVRAEATTSSRKKNRKRPISAVHVQPKFDLDNDFRFPPKPEQDEEVEEARKTLRRVGRPDVIRDKKAKEAFQALTGWASLANKILKKFEFEQVGFDVGEDGKFYNDRPSLRCPVCWKYITAGEERRHNKGCSLRQLLDLHEGIQSDIVALNGDGSKDANDDNEGNANNEALNVGRRRFVSTEQLTSAGSIMNSTSSVDGSLLWGDAS